MNTAGLKLTLLVAAVAAGGCDPEGQIEPEHVARAGKSYLAASAATKDRYIVVLKRGLAQKAVAGRTVADMAGNLQQQYGAKVLKTYEHALEGAVMEIPSTALAALKADSRIDYVEPDKIGSIVATESNATWGIDRVDQHNLPLNQNYTYPNQAGSGVHVYIIDTGIYAGHPEFARSGGGSRVGAGMDFQDNDTDPSDCHGHGTHVAGTIGSTTYGIAKGVTLHSMRVIDCFGFGAVSTAISAVDYVTGNHLNPAVANMSVHYGLSQALNTAVTNSIASGVTYAIAAANDSQDACNDSPGSTPNAITVGATDSADTLAYFSNFGSCVDVLAPGVGITSTWISPAMTNTIDGTSMASPHVAGSAALYLGAHPTATPADVRAALVGSATPNLFSNLPAGTPNLLLYMGFLNQSAPCAGLCNNPVNFTINSSFQSGNLGTGAVCYQTTSPVHGGICGNFVSPRVLRVNGVQEPCNNTNWSSLPLPRDGGYCVQTTAGNYSWASFSLW
jgi:subtilisin family serine protease